MKLNYLTIFTLVAFFITGAWAGSTATSHFIQPEIYSTLQVVYGKTDSPDDPKGNPIDILDIPAEIISRPDLNSIHLIQNSARRTVYKDDHGKHHDVTYKDSPIGPIQFAPDGKYRLGFYYRPEFLSLRSTSDIALAILDIENRGIKEVYRNNYHTSNWEWDGGDNVVVYYGCGSSCRYAFKIDAETGETINEYHIPIKTPPNNAGQI